MEYNLDTCVTAKELREDWGLAVPEDIPDDGWVPRASMLLGDLTATSLGTEVKVKMTLHFLEPFRWPPRWPRIQRIRLIPKGHPEYIDEPIDTKNALGG